MQDKGESYSLIGDLELDHSEPSASCQSFPDSLLHEVRSAKKQETLPNLPILSEEQRNELPQVKEYQQGQNKLQYSYDSHFDLPHVIDTKYQILLAVEKTARLSSQKTDTCSSSFQMQNKIELNSMNKSHIDPLSINSLSELKLRLEDQSPIDGIPYQQTFKIPRYNNSQVLPSLSPLPFYPTSNSSPNLQIDSQQFYQFTQSHHSQLQSQDISIDPNYHNQGEFCRNNNLNYFPNMDKNSIGDFNLIPPQIRDEMNRVNDSGNHQVQMNFPNTLGNIFELIINTKLIYQIKAGQENDKYPQHFQTQFHQIDLQPNFYQASSQLNTNQLFCPIFDRKSLHSSNIAIENSYQQEYQQYRLQASTQSQIPEPEHFFPFGVSNSTQQNSFSAFQQEQNDPHFSSEKVFRLPSYPDYSAQLEENHIFQNPQERIEQNGQYSRINSMQQQNYSPLQSIQQLHNFDISLQCKSSDKIINQETSSQKEIESEQIQFPTIINGQNKDSKQSNPQYTIQEDLEEVQVSSYSQSSKSSIVICPQIQLAKKALSMPTTPVQKFISSNKLPRKHSEVSDYLNIGEEETLRQQLSKVKLDRKLSQCRKQSSNNCSNQSLQDSLDSEKNSGDKWNEYFQELTQNKKNVVKNIMSAFKTFMLTWGEPEEILGIYNGLNENKEDFDGIRKKFKRYIESKSFNHYSLRLLILHSTYGQIFKSFLQNHSEEWLINSKIQDPTSHQKMILFFLTCFNDILIIDKLRRHPKKKCRFS